MKQFSLIREVFLNSWRRTLGFAIECCKCTTVSKKKVVSRWEQNEQFLKIKYVFQRENTSGPVRRTSCLCALKIRVLRAKFNERVAANVKTGAVIVFDWLMIR